MLPLPYYIIGLVNFIYFLISPLLGTLMASALVQILILSGSCTIFLTGLIASIPYTAVIGSYKLEPHLIRITNSWTVPLKQ